MRLSRALPACRKHRTMEYISRLLLISLCGLAASEPLAELLQRRRDAFEMYAREFTRNHEPYMFAAIPLHAPVPVMRVLSRTPLPPPRARDLQPAPSARHAAYARPYEPAPAPTPVYYSQYEDAAAQHSPLGARARRYSKPARQYSAEPEYDSSPYGYERPLYYQKPRRHAAYEYAPEYDSYAPQLHRVRPSALPQVAYALAPPMELPYDTVPYGAQQETAPTVLYARPSPSGGFTYRRVPDAAPAAASEPAHKKAAAPIKEKEPHYILKIHKYRIVKDDLI